MKKLHGSALTREAEAHAGALSKRLEVMRGSMLDGHFDLVQAVVCDAQPERDDPKYYVLSGLRSFPRLDIGDLQSSTALAGALEFIADEVARIHEHQQPDGAHVEVAVLAAALAWLAGWTGAEHGWVQSTVSPDGEATCPPLLFQLHTGKKALHLGAVSMELVRGITQAASATQALHLRSGLPSEPDERLERFEEQLRATVAQARQVHRTLRPDARVAPPAPH